MDENEHLFSDPIHKIRMDATTVMLAVVESQLVVQSLIFFTGTKTIFGMGSVELLSAICVCWQG